MSDTGASLTLHASCIAIDGRGALICGASGRGKSALALQLMAMGAGLVSDDRTNVMRDGARLIASAPDPIRGLIEARGVGLLQAEAAGPTDLALVIELDRLEPDRLPRLRHREYLSVPLPLLYRIDMPHFPAAILQYLRSGRREPA